MPHDTKNRELKLIRKINERFMNRKLIDLRSGLGKPDNLLLGIWLDTIMSDRDIDPTLVPILDYVDVCELIRDHISSYESLDNLTKEDLPSVRCNAYGLLTDEVLYLYQDDLPTKLFLSQTVREFYDFLRHIDSEMSSKSNWRKLGIQYRSICLNLKIPAPSKMMLVEALQQGRRCYLQPWIPSECSIEKFESNVKEGYEAVENILVNSFAIVFPKRFTMQSIYNKQSPDTG